jgi:4-diphosphocytidyl-2-C-methyl-D-erythritol kinase
VRVRRRSDGVEVLAPAKLNLFFEVVAKRPDGFHEIITLMAPLDIYDTITVSDVWPLQGAVANDPVVLECGWAPGLKAPRPVSNEAVNPGRVETEELPKGNDNIAVRAINLLRERAGLERHAKVRLTKRIPSAAGLGGGSSDAAAALVAANVAWNIGWSRQRLGQLAAELGSDVPFFLHSGPAVCRGRGEQIETVERFGRLQVVVVRPPAGLSTAAVYRVCRPNIVPRPVEPLLDSLRRGNVRQLGRRMHNALQGAATSLTPWIDRLAYEFARMDCLGSQMSGSGTSYFGLCRNARHAQAVAHRLKGRRIGRVFTAACG